MELLQNVASTLRFPEVGGDPVVFKGKPKVTAFRDSDGSEVLKAVEAEEVKEGEEDPYYQVKVAAEDLAEVDVLTVNWSGELEGGGKATFSTSAEIVGGYLVSVAEVQAKMKSGFAPKSDQDIAAKREVAIREIEDACGGVAFRPRYQRERIDGPGVTRLILKRRGLLRVIGVEVDGEALDSEALAALDLEEKGIVVRDTAWPLGKGNIAITYAYGFTNFPDAKEPVRDYTAYLLTPSSTDVGERATSMSNEAGTFALVTAGVRGARFPLPKVNAFVNRFGYGKPLVA